MTTFPETHKDLLDAPVAQLATVGRDGYPQLTSTWFIFDEGAIKISLNVARVKTKNLKRDPRVSLLIADPQNPYRYLAVRADARISPDPDGADADKVNAKYNARIQDNDKPGEERITVTLEPIGAFAWPVGGAHA
ncbi:MAG: PPOX class F420-dependent oxidoreductase [Solirubrobacteraceae bacterium]